MYQIKYKGFFAKIMEAERLVGDHTFGLPPGNPLSVYYVDEFLYPKEEWMTGPGSFVVPVRPKKGLWFDWTANSQINTAVVPTIKGCNPITGLKTDGFFLEKYVNKCPKHKCDFMAERFCPECGFKWPERNYQSMSPLWWDGFRADGVVRQFFFSEDELRDVASGLIGKKNTVPAYGFAFFTPKEVRSETVTVSNTGYYHTLVPDWVLDFSHPEYKSYSDSGCDDLIAKGVTLNTFSACNDEAPRSIFLSNCSTDLKDDVAQGALEERRKKAINNIKRRGFKKRIRSIGNVGIGTSSPKKSLEVSIGAGAKIRQDLNQDPYSLDSWKEKPDAVMTIYFIFQDEFEKLKNKGMRDLSGKKEGMLNGIPVG